MTNIRETLGDLGATLFCKGQDGDSGIVVDKEVLKAQAQLQKAFEEAVEEIINTSKSFIYIKGDNELETVKNIEETDLICELREELRAEQRTKAKQVIKEMFQL